MTAPPDATTGTGADTAAVRSAMAGLFGRDSLYLAFWFLQVLVAALATPFATRLLGASEFGTWSAANALMQVLGVLCGLGLSVAVQKFHEDRGLDAARRLTVLTAIAALAVTAAADLTGSLWSDPLGFGDYGGAVRLAVFWAGSSAVTVSLLALLRSQDRLAAFTTVSLVQSVLAEALSLVLLVLLEATAEAFVLGRLAAQLLAVLLGVLFTRLRTFRPRDLPLARAALVFGLPMVPAMLGSFVLGAADRFVIQEQIGRAEVAHYAVAYNLASLPLLVIGVVNAVWLPRFFAAGSGPDGDAVTVASRDALYRLLAPVMVGLSVVAPIALRVWAPPSYGPDALLLVFAVVVVSAVPYAAGYSATRVLLAAGRSRPVAVAAVVAAVANVALTIWWIPMWHLTGAALATFASYALQHAILLVPTRGRPFGTTRAGLLRAVAGAALAVAVVGLPTSTGGLVLRGVLALACLAWFAAEYAGIRSRSTLPEDPR